MVGRTNPARSPSLRLSVVLQPRVRRLRARAGARERIAPSQPSAPPTGNGQPVTSPPRRPPPSRDSLEKLRAVYVAQIMQEIAGRENRARRASVQERQVLKGITAAELVHKMDKDYADAAELELHELPSPGEPGQLGERHGERQEVARASCSR